MARYGLGVKYGCLGILLLMQAYAKDYSSLKNAIDVRQIKKHVFSEPGNILKIANIYLY